MKQLRVVVTRHEYSLDEMRSKLIARVEYEIDRDTENETQGQDQTQRQFNIVINNINKDVYREVIQKMQRRELSIILAAAEHPEFNVAKLLIGEPGSKLDDALLEHVLAVSMFFSLFHEAGIKEDSYGDALYCLRIISGEIYPADLRQEPDGYLMALLTIFKEMPKTLALSGNMHEELRAMLKEDPSLVHALIDYTVQRDSELRLVNPGAFREALTTASPSLRNGVL